MLLDNDGPETEVANTPTEPESWLSRLYRRFTGLFARRYSGVGDAGKDDSVDGNVEDQMPIRKDNGDTRRINRLAAASEQAEARLSLRDKVKAIALRKENVGPSESSRMLDDL